MPEMNGNRNGWSESGICMGQPPHLEAHSYKTYLI